MKAFSGAELRRVRLMLKLSHSVVVEKAHALGYKLQILDINRMERGKVRNPSSEKIAAVAEALGVPVDMLYRSVKREREAVSA